MPMKPIRPRRNSVGTFIFYNHAAADRGMQAARGVRDIEVERRGPQSEPRPSGSVCRPRTVTAILTLPYGRRAPIQCATSEFGITMPCFLRRARRFFAAQVRKDARA